MTQPTQPIDPEILKSLQASLYANGQRETARRLGINHRTLANVVSRGSASLAVLAKIRGKVTTASDYPRAPELTQVRKRTPQLGWTLESIRSARDAQSQGNFGPAAQLAKAMQGDDPIFVARSNRAAPLTELTTRLQSTGGTRGEPIAKAAAIGVSVPRYALASLGVTMAMHGVSFGYNRRTRSEDGSREDFRLEEWPIESVRWIEAKGSFFARTADGEVPITHGDGYWTVFKKYDLQPWLQEAAILALALVFAAHLEAIRAWGGAINSHGMAKIVGELPAGMALLSDDGVSLSPEAQSFLDMLADIVSGDAGAGIIPAGAKANFISNTSSAWQVFSELINNRERAAARILLGNDGMLGSSTSAPGVDVATLFGVAAAKVKGDVSALEIGLYEGVFMPWAAVNYADSSRAPRYVFEIPSEDANEKIDQRQKATDSLFSLLDRYRSSGMEITQVTIDVLAELYGVEPVPKLAAVASRSVPLALAPTDVAKVVRAREARASQGLEPFGDERDDMTIAQLDGWVKSPTVSTSAAIAPEAAGETAAPVLP